MFINEGITPACFVNACDIQDIQSGEDSVELNNLVDAFISCEGLAGAGSYTGIIERTRDESGLNDLDISTILELKSIWNSWVASKQQQANQGTQLSGIRKR